MKNETSNEEESGASFYLKEINILTEEMNKKSYLL